MSRLSPPSPSAPTSTGFRFTRWPTEYRRSTRLQQRSAYYASGADRARRAGHQAPLNSRILPARPTRSVRREAEGHLWQRSCVTTTLPHYHAHLQQVNVAGRPGRRRPAAGAGGRYRQLRGAHLHLTLYKDGATAVARHGSLRHHRPTPFVNALRAAEWRRRSRRCSMAGVSPQASSERRAGPG